MDKPTVLYFNTMKIKMYNLRMVRLLTQMLEVKLLSTIFIKFDKNSDQF